MTYAVTGLSHPGIPVCSRSSERCWQGVDCPIEQDDLRSEQEVLKSEQEAHSNTIAELLREVGMPAGDPCRSDYLAWLAQQRTPEGTPVPPRLLDEIARTHVRLRLVMEQLAEIEEQ